MMLVVHTLAEMVGAGASPVVLVFGNLFVMGMEGLIVCIQVLRLEFYEIFSRFFEGNGTPFVPVASPGGGSLSLFWPRAFDPAGPANRYVPIRRGRKKS